MTSKTKINLLYNLNQFVVGDFLVNFQSLQEKWTSMEIQKKLGTIVGLKPREVLQGPQRNISAYLFFCEDKRKEILEQNPGIKPNKVMILFGESWRKLTEEEKSPYIDKATQDRDRYIKYLESTKSSIKKQVKPSAYNLFCADERKVLKVEMPHLSTSDVRKELGRRWKSAKENDLQMLKTKYGYSVS